MKRAVSCAMFLSLLQGGHVYAQADEGFALEEIVVTARKRSENLQDVPDAVTYIGETMINDAGLDSLEKISDLTPNLSMNYAFRRSVIFLSVRGINTPQYGDSPVSFVVDGATVPDVDFINQGIFDVENIQVMRGPQGALYGRGALAGAILINTKRPTNEFSGNVGVIDKSGGDTRFYGAVSGPIIEDKLLFRVGGFQRDRDGQIKNTAGELVDFIRDEYEVRGMLEYLATEDLNIRFTAKKTDGEYGESLQTIIDNDDFDNHESYDKIAQDYIGVNWRDTESYILNVDWESPLGTVSAVTYYDEGNDLIYADTWTEDDWPIQAEDNYKDSFSQEIRLTSPSDNAFRWIVGASYTERYWDYQYERVPVACTTCKPDWDPKTSPTLAFDMDQNAESIGLFVNTSWDITDRIELSAAVRYDKDERDRIDPAADQAAADAAGDPSIATRGKQELEFSEVQPKVSLSYQATDDLLTYISYSEGFRSGGFNSAIFAFQPESYEKELSTSFEAGAKWTGLDGRLIMNGAVFTSEVEEYQFSIFDGFALGTLGIDEVDIYGLELEAQFRPVEELTLSLGYGYADTEIQSFDGSGDANDQEAKGNPAPRNPKHTLNTSARYTIELGDDTRLVAYASYREIGEQSWNWLDSPTSGPSRYVDAKLTLEVSDLSISVFGENLKDERRVTDAFAWIPGVSSGVTVSNNPRSYGVEARYNF